ncbi:hypothetical protein [Streptomyces scabiei]|uniref:hypothetical protein n=1 Tax=Streptomyces scabiei TaxID=1930 RepID=UPI00131A7D3B|nr:hypothetical protein [Streptomyces scabiei]
MGAVLAALATVLGAVAAVGGIVFTAIATFYSAEVAEDQLQQSKEDAAKETRAQASKVAFYGDTNGMILYGKKYSVVNRSADPVTDVTAFLVAHVKSKFPKHILDAPILEMHLGYIPPCSRIVLTSSNLATFNEQGSLEALPGGQSFAVMVLQFTDSDGREWGRSSTQLVEVKPVPFDGNLQGPEPLVLSRSKPVVTKAVKPCGGI